MYYLSIFAFYTHFYMVICPESCEIFLAKKALAYILMPVHTLGHTQTSIFCRVWTRLWHLWLHTPGAGHYLVTWNERLLSTPSQVLHPFPSKWTLSAQLRRQKENQERQRQKAPVSQNSHFTS